MRVLFSAESSRERAILLGLFDLKMPLSRSSALECLVTLEDHFLVDLRVVVFEAELVARLEEELFLAGLCGCFFVAGMVVKLNDPAGPGGPAGSLVIRWEKSGWAGWSLRVRRGG